MIIKKIQSVRGMHDCLPKEVILWQKIEKILTTTLNGYGYNEIRFPIVEFTELFKRSIGQMTDVIEKEMYSFNYNHHYDDYSLTLRPEGTSGCVRAGIEHALFYNNQEQRLWYLGPMFRHERPQKGRYRQFHQCSAEAFGHIGPDIDVELILIATRFWKILGISQNLTLEINSIGSLTSRIIYQKQLIEFFNKNLHYLDHDDICRLHSNPLRILDSKKIEIQKLLINAPKLNDYLDDDSWDHFNKLCELLDSFNILYTVNPYLVRGLDYYNRTVFEWCFNNAGIKNTVCAGGRYDELVKHLGGQTVPAVGFAIGIERLLLLMKSINSPIVNINMYVHVYVINLGLGTQKYAMLLSEFIREKLPYLRLAVDYGVSNLKKKFNRAIKNNSNVVLIIDEINVIKKTIVLKDLDSGQKDIIQYSNIINVLEQLFKK